MQPIIDWIFAHLETVVLPVATGFGGIILRHISPRLAGFMRRNLDAFLGWVQRADDGIGGPAFVHNIWDQGWGAIVGAVEQVAGDPDMVYQVARIIKGQPDLRRERLTKLLEEHINAPDFKGIIVANLPEELKDIWNSVKNDEAVKAIVAKSSAAGAPVAPVAAQAIVKNLAPAARVLAAENPVESKPMRAPEMQALVEQLRSKNAEK